MAGRSAASGRSWVWGRGPTLGLDRTFTSSAGVDGEGRTEGEVNGRLGSRAERCSHDIELVRGPGVGS